MRRSRAGLVHWLPTARRIGINRKTCWAPLLAADAKKVLYRLYAERLASLALQAKDPDWDGATRFDSK
jgi:hypothetical protein